MALPGLAQSSRGERPCTCRRPKLYRKYVRVSQLLVLVLAIEMWCKAAADLPAADSASRQLPIK